MRPRKRAASVEPSKKLVYIHQYYKAPDDPAGSGTRSHEFAKRLSEGEFDVHIVSSDRSDFRFRGWKTDERDGYTVHRISVPYSGRMTYAQRGWAFVKFAIGSGAYARKLRGDLIFATSTPLTVIIPALVARMFRRTPQVFEVRDLWPEMPIALGVLRGRPLIAAARWLERLAYRTSEHVVALSPGMKDGVVAAGMDPDRVSVIPNAADLDTFGVDYGDKNPWLDAHPELHDRPLVVYCGTLNKLNGVGYLVEVAARARESSPETAFVVVGSGTEEEMIAERAVQLGILDVNFFMYGRVSKTEMPQVTAAATITTSLFIPVKEMEANSANKFFDGLGAGRPVAINYGGWQRSLLLEHQAGLSLDGNDPESAAQDLVELVNDRDRTAELGRNARALAEKKFARDDLAQQLIDVFNRVLAA